MINGTNQTDQRRVGNGAGDLDRLQVVGALGRAGEI